MRISKLKVCATLVIGLTAVSVRAAALDIDQHAAAAVTQSLLSRAPVRGQPYSATKYVRTVKTLTDGKQEVRNDDDSMRLARDSKGRLLVEHKLKCPPESPAPPWCGTQESILFDPGAFAITFWLHGANAGHAATTIKMTAAQMKDELTKLSPQVGTSGSPTPQTIVTTEDLGQQECEGVPVIGVGTKTVRSVGYSGNDASSMTSREVWTSAEMKLVMKVVSTDSHSGKTTSGLENFSRHPEASLFHSPVGYSEILVNLSGAQNKIALLYLKKLADAEVE